jgi:hypothetical protein
LWWGWWRRRRPDIVVFGIDPAHDAEEARGSVHARVARPVLDHGTGTGTGTGVVIVVADDQRTHEGGVDVAIVVELGHILGTGGFIVVARIVVGATPAFFSSSSSSAVVAFRAEARSIQKRCGAFDGVEFDRRGQCTGRRGERGRPLPRRRRRQEAPPVVVAHTLSRV